jgi:hypothetical protein
MPGNCLLLCCLASTVKSWQMVLLASHQPPAANDKLPQGQKEGAVSAAVVKTSCCCKGLHAVILQWGNCRSSFSQQCSRHPERNVSAAIELSSRLHSATRKKRENKPREKLRKSTSNSRMHAAMVSQGHNKSIE